MKQVEFEKQFPLNFVSNIAYFALSAVAGIWLTPFLIGKMGVAAWGLIPLAININAYLDIFSISFNSAISRFLTIDLSRDNSSEANKTFNTSLCGSIAILLLLLPVALVIVYNVPKFFDIPSELEKESVPLFGMMIGVFYLQAISSNFAVSSFAKNRFELRNLVRSSEIVMRVIFLVLLFNYFPAKLWFVGISYLVGTLVTLMGSVLVWRMITPELSISPHAFDKSKISSISSVSGWVFLDQIGTVLLINTEVILVNRICGAENAGYYSVILPWVVLLRAIAGLYVSLLTPIYLSYFVTSEIEKIKTLLKKSIKFTSYLVALPIGLLCGSSPYLLSIWIGPEFSRLAPLMCLLLGPLALTISIMPVYGIQITFNKVRTPAIVTLLMGIFLILASILFSGVFGWGIYGVGAATVLAYFIRSVLFSSVYVSKILKEHSLSFIKIPFQGFILMFVIAVLSFLFSSSLKPTTWIELISIYLVISVAYLSVLYIILKKEEREFILALIQRKT